MLFGLVVEVLLAFVVESEVFIIEFELHSALDGHTTKQIILVNVWLAVGMGYVNSV